MTYRDDTRAIIEDLQARFPILGPLVLEEIPDGGFAYYTPDPVPTIQFPTTWDPAAQPRIIRHEVGHALHDAGAKAREAVYHRGTGAYDVLRDYWAARGFPGTWQAARAKADAMQAAGDWYLNYQRFRPQENIADTFAAVLLDKPIEDPMFTETYGVPLDKIKMLTFYHNIEKETDDMSKWVSEDIALATDATGRADLSNIRIPSAGFDPSKPLMAQAQRIGLVGSEGTLPQVSAAAAFDAGGPYAVLHVRSDPVRNGTAYFRIGVWQ